MLDELHSALTAQRTLLRCLMPIYNQLLNFHNLFLMVLSLCFIVVNQNDFK